VVAPCRGWGERDGSGGDQVDLRAVTDAKRAVDALVLLHRKVAVVIVIGDLQDVVAADC
jgi:hypothetical protein